MVGNAKITSLGENSQVQSGRYKNSRIIQQLKDLTGKISGIEERLNKFDSLLLDISDQQKQYRTEYMLKILLAPLADSKKITKKLYTAIEAGDAEQVRLLADLGADIEHQYFMLRRPIHLAAKFSSAPVLEALLNLGANIDAVDIYGQNALHVTSSEGCLKCAQVLLDNGVNIESKDSFLYSPLILAATSNSSKLVELLLSKGAAVNAANGVNYTALHAATERGFCYECVVILLEHGADMNLKTVEGKTAFDLSFGNENQKIIDLLVQRGNKTILIDKTKCTTSGL